MGNSAASNESIYQASLVTEQRALAGHQDAIDIMQRLLASMGDDPLLVKTKENLTKILENPEVITDEVFNNIMSKTGEILDTNYDQQVQEVLGAARASGVSGPALQVTLQKAKEARATAMASAYRDAIIERSASGLKTSMDAITSASNLLTQLFDQQRVLTTDIANVMRETVAAPFRNYGVDDVQAGGEGGNGASLGGYGSTPASDYSNVAGYKLGDLTRADEAASAAQGVGSAQQSDAAFQASQAARNAASKWNPDGTPKATTPAAPQAVPNAVPGQPGAPVSLTADERGPASGTGTITIAGKKFSVSADGVMTPVDYESYDTTNRTLASGVLTQNANPLSPASTQYPYDTTSPVAQAEKSSAMETETIQAAVAAAMKPLSYSATAVQNQFAPAQSTLAPSTILGTAYNNGNPYSESTLQSPAGTISAGGGAEEASRGQDLVSTYGMDKVIGSTAGYGVRQTGTIAGSVSAGDALSDIYDSNSGYRTSATPYAGETYDAAAQKAASDPYPTLKSVGIGHVGDAEAKAYNERVLAEWHARQKAKQGQAATPAIKTYTPGYTPVTAPASSAYDPNMSTEGGGYRHA